MSGRIFINYRRENSAAAAGRLADRLARHFDQQLFMDIDNIEPGVDFIKTLNEQVAQCEAFIAVIGPGWADHKNSAGTRRLDDPHDYVRVEIEAALQRDIRVIPVLVDGAKMPTAEELPDSLKLLTRRHAIELSHGRFGAEVDDLARALQRIVAPQPKAPRQISGKAIGPKFGFYLRDLLSFKGRVSRKSFWLGTLFVIALGFALGLPLYLAAAYSFGFRIATIAIIIAWLPLCWPVLALALKRLHDLDRPNLFWIPCISVFLILFGTTKFFF